MNVWMWLRTILLGGVLISSLVESRLISRCDLQNQLQNEFPGNCKDGMSDSKALEDLVAKIICKVRLTSYFNTSQVTTVDQLVPGMLVEESYEVRDKRGFNPNSRQKEVGLPFGSSRVPANNVKSGLEKGNKGGQGSRDKRDVKPTTRGDDKGLSPGAKHGETGSKRGEGSRGKRHALSSVVPPHPLGIPGNVSGAGRKAARDHGHGGRSKRDVPSGGRREGAGSTESSGLRGGGQNNRVRRDVKGHGRHWGTEAVVSSREHSLGSSGRNENVGHGTGKKDGHVSRGKRETRPNGKQERVGSGNAGADSDLTRRHGPGSRPNHGSRGKRHADPVGRREKSGLKIHPQVVLGSPRTDANDGGLNSLYNAGMSASPASPGSADRFPGHQDSSSRSAMRGSTSGKRDKGSREKREVWSEAWWQDAGSAVPIWSGPMALPPPSFREGQRNMKHGCLPIGPFRDGQQDGQEAESSGEALEEGMGGRLYGLFQLSNHEACKSGSTPSLNICQMECSELINDDISDDIACLKALQKAKMMINMMFPDECATASTASEYLAEC
ncbi:hornerin-like [Denticeps clupeoides]|uniref:hornerin-like n=1 Tax=Denticeps clupeoides TaxID=299321 RepID=UPI0010A5787B|nr:hornerin-like [Denticeps clupeoides]